MEPAEAAKASRLVRDHPALTGSVVSGDFLKFFVWEGAQCPRFDAVLGNPPFVRYQYLPEVQQMFSEKIFARFGLPFTKHTNAWVPFVIASISLLAAGGRLAMVLPAEILHIRHALGLRRFLAAECSRVLVLDPEELYFEDTLQGTVLLLAEKKDVRKANGGAVAVKSVSGKSAFQGSATEYFSSAPWVREGVEEGKWMPLLLSNQERALLNDLAESEHVCVLKELAEVDVGIVTGANQYFLVSDETVKQYELSRWAHPMFGRSEHVRGVIYGEEDHEANRVAGLPANFLWFDDDEIAAFPASVQAYLRAGEAQGLPRRYKCRIREPWYRVPSVYAAPVAMLKRCHHFPRLVLNRAGAYTTDTAYRVRVKADPHTLVFSFINSLTCLSAELEGRHYGGGVLELVPSEIERLLLPRADATEVQLLNLDQRFRMRLPSDELLRAQDTVLLGSLGVAQGDQATLLQAWDRLRRRRQRVGTAAEKSTAETLD
jgi:adenine-specific DNA methylase